MIVIGWREWLALPDLKVGQIKAKIDTGARTSALHADEVEFFRRRRRDYVRFVVLPTQRSSAGAITTTTPLLDQRRVRSSNGQLERRPVIETSIELAGQCWEIELTLTSRDVMGFRMLLGRQAMRGQIMVDPAKSYLAGRRPRSRR